MTHSQIQPPLPAPEPLRWGADCPVHPRTCPLPCAGARLSPVYAGRLPEPPGRSGQGQRPRGELNALTTLLDLLTLKTRQKESVNYYFE